MKYHVENNEVCNLYSYCNKTYYAIIVDREASSTEVNNPSFQKNYSLLYVNCVVLNYKEICFRNIFSVIRKYTLKFNYK